MQYKNPMAALLVITAAVVATTSALATGTSTEARPLPVEPAVPVDDTAPDEPPIGVASFTTPPVATTAPAAATSTTDAVVSTPPEAGSTTMATPTTATTTTATPTTVSVPAPPATTAPAAKRDRFCGDEIVALVDRLLAPHQIPAPIIEVGTTERAYYLPGVVTVVYAACETVSVVAHELGHYVHQRALSMSFGAMVDDALASFCPGGDDGTGRCAAGWIKGVEHYPGIEHAAHCIGQVLGGAGTYTNCPDPTLLATARDRVDAT